MTDPAIHEQTHYPQPLAPSREGIDLSAEQLFALRELPHYLPRRRGGRKTHCSTGYRWASAGVRGVVLETLRIGGTRYTSVEALARFAQRLSAPGKPVVRSPAQRVRAVAATEKELDRLGV